MRLEEQVVSLELSKKLKELGVNQFSMFYWRKKVSGEYDLVYRDMTQVFGMSAERLTSAFTVAELGETLPKDISSFKDVGKNNRTLKGWICRQYNYRRGESIIFDAVDFYGNTEANARAKLLIYLLENNIVKL